MNRKAKRHKWKVRGCNDDTAEEFEVAVGTICNE